MPLNEKIVSLISEQCNKVGERCDGYRDKLIELISGIIEDEEDHRISKMNIQQKINNRFDDAARFLANHREHHSSADETDSW